MYIRPDNTFYVGDMQPGDREATAQEIAAHLAQVPNQITSFQAKAALLNAGLLARVKEMMANPAMDEFARLAWDEETAFHRDSPTLKTMAAVLGLTDAQLDALFTYGAGVKA